MDVINTKQEIGMDHTGAETSIANLRFKMDEIIKEAEKEKFMISRDAIMYISDL